MSSLRTTDDMHPKPRVHYREDGVKLLTMTVTLPIEYFPAEFHLYPAGTIMITKEITVPADLFPAIVYSIENPV